MRIPKVQWSKTKWANNTVNNTSSKLGVDIIEATPNSSSYTDKAPDLYPYGATEFTKVADYQITNIDMENRIVTFNVNGGGQALLLDVESIKQADVKTQKIIENGRVFILREGLKFDILGNRL
jgi:hypothetical protein